jgi:hypothetical protein
MLKSQFAPAAIRGKRIAAKSAERQQDESSSREPNEPIGAAVRVEERPLRESILNAKEWPNLDPKM